MIFAALSSAARAGGAVSEDAFPRPAAIEGNVQFWIRVFSEWRLGQAVVHDAERPELIYEVVELPGRAEETYTAEQRSYLDAVVAGWSGYLTQLEARVASGAPLADLDKQWVLHIATHAGTDGIRGAAGRLRTQRGLRERFREGLERSGRYEDAIRHILEEEGVPPDLAYLPHVESSFQWHARSKVGAAGLWQFTRGTGQRYLKITSEVDERLDPLAATQAAARYLREAHDQLGCWALALTSYNHGLYGMAKAKELHGDFETVYRDYRGRGFGFASRNFYAEFLAAREVASNADRYFPEGVVRESPIDEELLILARGATPEGIARTYGVETAQLLRMNPAWGTRARSRSTTLPAGTRVWLPAGSLEAAARRGASLPEPHAAQENTGSWYVVRAGDTLGRIAQRFGLSLGSLCNLNDLKRSAVIRPGQRLRVSAEGPAAHVVQRGETLNKIAGRYRVELGELLRINSLDLDSVIHPGQKLRIP